MTAKTTLPSLALIALFSLAPAAMAAETPAPVAAPAATPAANGSLPQLASAEDCKRIGLDLAQTAEDKKLPDAKLETLEDLMARMSDFCAEQKYAEASALAKDLKTLIDKM